MHREIHKWNSSNLHKEMEIAVYGHYGYALLLFPTAGSDHLEYERFYLIDSIADFINSGTVKIFSVNSINSESWMNRNINPVQKIERQEQYNKYIVEEVIPLIEEHCRGRVPIVTAGASLGAYHAANTFFRRPELFTGMIAMSGLYDLKKYTDGYFNNSCYFNSPVDYLPGLSDESILSEMRYKNIIIACGQGAYEDPPASQKLSDILHSKNIPHWFDLWGEDMTHDWPTWRKMLPYFLDNINV